MVLIKLFWRFLVLLGISLIVMLAIGQIQLYILTSVNSFEDIKIGYPYWYYSFSRDGNNFHGGNVNNLIIDYCITVLVVSIFYVFVGLIKKRFYNK